MRRVTCPNCGTQADVPSETAEAVRCDKCAVRIPLRRPTTPLPPVATSSAFPTAEVVEEPATRYPVSQYKLPPRGNPVGLVPVAVVALGAAIVLAVVCHFVAQLYWLALLFAGLQGVAIGYTAGYVARQCKLRLQQHVGVIAAVAGFLSAVLIHVFDCLAFAGLGFPFLDFMHKRAEVGVQLSSSNLGYTGTILYWVAELLMTVCLAYSFGWDAVNEPFCEKCDNWKPKRTIGPVQLFPPIVLDAIEGGTPAVAVVPGDDKCRVTLEIYACPECREDSEVEVKAAGSWAEGRTEKSRFAYVTYPGAALPEFDRIEQTCKDQELVIKD